MVIFSRAAMLFQLFCVLFFCLSTSVYAQNKKKLDSLFREFDKVIYLNFNEAERLAFETLKLNEGSTYLDYGFKSYLSLIKVFTLKKDYKKAKEYIDKAIAIEDSIRNTSLKTDLYNSIGYIENIGLNHNISLKYYNKAIDLALNSNDSLRLSESYIGKAGLHIGRQEFNEARELIKFAVKISTQNNFNRILSRAYYSLGSINYTVKDSALYLYREALKNSILDENKFRQGEIHSDLAFLYLYHSELDSVMPHINKSVKLAKEVGSKSTLHNIYYTLGYYYDALGDYKKSIKNHKKAINDYGDYVSPVQLCNAYIMLSGALWHNGNYKEAYDYQDKYIVLKDSIFNEHKAKEFNNIRTKYEVEKKDAAIALLEKENEIEETRKKWLGASAVFLSLTLLGVFLFFRHKIKTKNIILSQEKELHNKEMEQSQKEKELTEIKAYINGQEKERNRLAKELHDGIGGQLASINLALTHINTDLKNDSIKKVSDNLVNSFQELRALSHSLSTNMLKGKTFETLLGELKKQFEENNNLKIEVSIFPSDILDDLDANITHNLYRILQELLTNVIKHAKATFVELSFNKHENVLVVVLEDNGCGFEVGGKNYGIGIKNIEERILTLNGSFNIDSQVNRGTQVVFEIPLKKQ